MVSLAPCPATCEHRCQHPGSWGHSMLLKGLLEPQLSRSKGLGPGIDHLSLVSGTE
ncbi:rCG32198 [Rattus norvegicus]|uniref:RCG32198 n=1 Tax=Rattus norvegicus TaxID=10116 RepID=A6JXK9_RAT|nr:rCG32198 [Rattus norvegicus]